jgi:uncharacterized protein YuzE
MNLTDQVQDTVTLDRPTRLDMDADGNIVGIEIEHASTSVDLTNLSFATLPFQRTKSA